ncbi:MAG: TlpA family protein disulfide reductase [Planctomycetaceae bacterium]|nr:TlpA family protein disulfide reductase [Planctomycetaceae bacterium]
MKRTLAFLLACVVMALPAVALDLGDPAPALSVDKWITGEPADPTQNDGKTFYLVEVWSVTCPPCVQSIPIMSDIQKRYGDEGLKIVSFTTDAEEDVTPFLEQHPMEYSSFLDKEGGSMVSYMAADNRNTIPHAFLFDREGALVWIGNPLDNLENRVKDVLSGRLNREHAIAVRDAREDLQDAFTAQNIAGMLTTLTTLEGLEPDNGQYYQVHYRLLTELGAGDENDVQALLGRWYAGSESSPEGLMILSVLAMDQGHPSMRNPGLAVAAARRAYALDSDLKVQAGLNLAETYKSIGRFDLAKETLNEIAGMTTNDDERAMIEAVQEFFTRIEEVAKDPAAAQP